MVVFLTGLFGYLLGAGLVVTGLLKPLLASRTGLWMSGGEMVASGTQSVAPALPAREVLGWWYVPAALVLGCVLVIVTTLLIRMFLRLARHVQGYVPAAQRAAFGLLLLVWVGVVGLGDCSIKATPATAGLCRRTGCWQRCLGVKHR